MVDTYLEDPCRGDGADSGRGELFLQAGAPWPQKTRGVGLEIQGLARDGSLTGDSGGAPTVGDESAGAEADSSLRGPS